jgi:type II secretory ATPase GspE/PulE/Tfp pilus assembly ATPase PilB-like protein
MVWSLLAQAAAPPVSPGGPYIAWWKVIPLVIVMILWGRLVTWIDKDSQTVLLPRIPMNVGMLMGGILGFFLFFLLPGFGIAFIALCVIILAEAGTYLAIRNSKAGLGDIGDQFKAWVESWKGGEKVVKVVAGEVQLIGKNGNLLPEPEAEDPDRPAYESIQQIFTDPLRRNAERVDVTPVDTSVAVRYIVDGVAYGGATLEKNKAAAAIEYMKVLSGLDTNERRKPQSGSMRVSLDGQKRELQVVTAGSTAGEQMRTLVDPKKRHQQKLDELGMSPEQVELVRAVIQEGSGTVLVCAPRAQGLTTMLYAILRAHDAFLQHLHTIESDQQADLEGITQNKLPATPAPGEEVKTVGWVISQEPDVIMISNVNDPKTAIQLAKFANGENRRIYVGMRAGSTFDALAMWRKMIGEDTLAMRNLRMIICGRVMRRLCGACKVGYTPDPQTLRRLNMDPDKVGKLYQARTQPMRDAKGNPIMCDFCKELYFKGRMGVYEIFLIDDDVRAVIEGGGSINQLKAVFRKQRGKYLQEAALAQVEEGETSVQEVLRVMKADDKGSGGQRPSK